ncbi:cbb3-type cytochrome c oxidase subunit 3 [Notoacmeibacter sp. MSK16QG-6]|uniref:cbb3-type cytochrome c oxidase subunit 3 n=1 Tax=Notoacmeibacter sp. MSK16QG-6 TaxID=2957982 RepID=UPI00209F0AA3|nr:cbb3-type cytochrome c oxidase subunit 3 [Notoacmeibacter sp. MSK16QG-6]MCP1198654.1 cbb3-type cytochrome c oxidase subunit 3 [Notoacmeibacter sp. MSK16QG-6]
MELTYDAMRHFADSWGLLGMLAFFLAAVLMVLRPGARSRAEDAAQIPFKED